MTMTTIEIPEFCVLLLIGPSGAGKTTFAHRHFAPGEILSSDALRAMVCDDADSLDATADAFAVLKDVLARRLAHRRLTVVDATNLRPEDRAQFVEIANRGYAPVVALLLDIPEHTCLERNRTRPSPRPTHVVRRQSELFRKTAKGVRRERFSHVHRITENEVDGVSLVRQRLWTDRRNETGPFDIIGDVHGCLPELRALLERLGYAVAERREADGQRRFAVSHPQGRRLVFTGDLNDRGPDSPGVLALVMDAVAAGAALSMKGNHELALLRWLRGGEVSDKHGFDRTVAQLMEEPDAFKLRLKDFLSSLRSHAMLDGGALVVAHAGVKEAMQGKGSRLVSDFCMFGETSGEADMFGLRVRHNWAAEYRGKATVVYGHTPTPEVEWIGNTLCLDTGCVFGGSLTALRWPERMIVQVPAERVWYTPLRPIVSPVCKFPAIRLPDAAILTAKAVVETRWGRPVTIQESEAAAAFEGLTRFAADPRWLIHVPPTTATVEASAMEDWLERPEEAFDHYAKAAAPRVMVQKKHMGSRAVVVACRDRAAAKHRFGDGSRDGIVLSKSGHPFFDHPAWESHVVDGVRDAADAAGLWDRLETDWIILDGEMLPWNVKADTLIRDTFAGTGCAGAESARAMHEALAAAAARGVEEADALAVRAGERGQAIAAFRRAYGRYVQPCREPADLRYAPFHLLAAEGRVFAEESHDWHMEIAEALADAAPTLIEPTPWIVLNPADAAARARAVDWWLELTADGHEGYIVKGPCLAPRGKGMAPSIKVRGKEYLRIIYGAEYDRPDVLPGLKTRATVRKRSMARIGASLGLESLSRFVEGASLVRVHEVVAASIAVVSEPLDTRL